MKKSQLRQLIREEIKRIHEQSPSGGYFCMNDDNLTLPGYCVQQLGGQSVYEAMQDAVMGIWAQHITLDACLASPECSQHYTYSQYPPKPTLDTFGNVVSPVGGPSAYTPVGPDTDGGRFGAPKSQRINPPRPFGQKKNFPGSPGGVNPFGNL